MLCPCHPPFDSAAEEIFDRRVASRELRRYRRKGARLTTRRLRDGVRVHCPDAATLLDIGAGVGALTFSLLEAGMQRATVVDASSAFLESGREEAARRSFDQQIDWRHGDFVAVAPSLPVADVVALDRVVYCYPAIGELLVAAAGHARSCLAMSHPLERWYVRERGIGAEYGAASHGQCLRRVRPPCHADGRNCSSPGIRAGKPAWQAGMASGRVRSPRVLNRIVDASPPSADPDPAEGTGSGMPDPDMKVLRFGHSRRS